METDYDIRRIVGDDSKPLSAFKDVLAKAEAAQMQMRDLQKRLDKLEATRGIVAPAQAAVTRTFVQPTTTAPAAISAEEIQRALAEMPAHERAHLLTRLALAVPDGRKAK